jgi:4-diphosphocytidyl-2-C-methyl-D-erythritol kinase
VQSTLEVSGPAASGIPTDTSNLILRAEQAWRGAGGIAPLLDWSLIKNIPAGAGLGGGSGNAAAAFRLLEAVGDGSAVTNLAQLALEVGSDVPFFLEQESAVLLGGRGETRLATASAAEGWVVMAVPPFAVNTGWVFAQLETVPCAPGASGVASEEALMLPPLPQENDLLAAAEKAYPELQEFHAKLDSSADFQLSGSGGTFFAFFPDFEAAERCAAQTRQLCSQVFVAPLQHGAILRTPIPTPTAGASA